MGINDDDIKDDNNPVAQGGTDADGTDGGPADTGSAPGTDADGTDGGAADADGTDGGAR